jgi:O-antigen/teichoic acid export membrane protein
VSASSSDLAEPSRPKSLRAETAKAFRWAAGSKFVAQAIGWIFTLLTIRLLDPADYGRMAMVMVVIAFANFFTEFGFSASIIRETHLDKRKISCIFGLSLIFNFLVFVVVFLSAPLISLYFKTDINAEIRLLSVQFLLVPWGRIYESQLMRELNFRARSLIQESAYLIGVIASFVLALAGFGVWALIWGVLIATACRVLGFTVLAPERVLPAWNVREGRAILAFGSGLTAQRLAAWLQNQISIMVLGRLVDATSLGHFNVARTLVATPSNKLGQLLSQLPLAAFARLQHDRTALRDALAESLCMLLRATLPLFVLISLTAPEIVALALGPSWTEIGPIMALLALAMPLQIVHAVTLQALNALGKPLVGAWIMALLAVALGIATGLSAAHGLAMVALAWTVTYAAVSLVGIAWSGRHTGLGVLALATTAWRPLTCSAVLLGVGTLVRALLPGVWPAWLLLAVLLAVAGVVFALAVLLLDRRGLLQTLRFLKT